MDKKTADNIAEDIMHQFIDYLNRDYITQPFTQYDESIIIEEQTNQYNGENDYYIQLDVKTSNTHQKLFTLTNNNGIRFYVTELTPNDLSIIDYLITLLNMKLLEL